MQNKKMGFFTRLKKSIFKFEEYEKFIEEPLKRAFGYFFKLMLIFSLLITIALIYTVNSNVKSFRAALETEFPDFKIENNFLRIEEKDSFEYYFEDYDVQLMLDETQENYIENDYDNCLIMLKNSMIVKYSGYTQEIGYNSIDSISKHTIIEFFGTQQWKVLFVYIFLMMLFLNFISYSIIMILDVVILSILGLIINTFIGTRFKYKDLVKISIYAMTLPIILYLFYIIANILFGTTIKLFEIAYSAISYIYLITVMLMMKSDAIKNMQELQSVLEEQKRVKEELKRQAEEEKEKQRQKENEKEEEKKQRKKEKGENPQEPQTDNG